MFNPYSIILGLFVVAGLGATIWGLRVIIMARRSLGWPSVEGKIEVSEISSDEFDLLPHIEYSYCVDKRTFQQTLKFPSDITPTKEFAQNYVDNYFVGKKVQVYYDSHNPNHSTLEPGLAKGDWLVLAIGLGMLVIGVMLFFVAG